MSGNRTVCEICGAPAAISVATAVKAGEDKGWGLVRIAEMHTYCEDHAPPEPAQLPADEEDYTYPPVKGGLYPPPPYNPRAYPATTDTEKGTVIDCRTADAKIASQIASQIADLQTAVSLLVDEVGTLRKMFIQGMEAAAQDVDNLNRRIDAQGGDGYAHG